MLKSLREETEGKLQMLLSPRQNDLDSLFKEVRVFKSRSIPPKKLFSLGCEGHTEIFGPHPFTWKTHTPPKDIRIKKFGFGFFCHA